MRESHHDDLLQRCCTHADKCPTGNNPSSPAIILLWYTSARTRGEVRARVRSSMYLYVHIIIISYYTRYYRRNPINRGFSFGAYHACPLRRRATWSSRSPKHTVYMYNIYVPTLYSHTGVHIGCIYLRRIKIYRRAA